MNDPLKPRVGGILSADIAVPDHERVVRFYSQILGTGKDPLWREDLTNNLGMAIIGLGERTADYADLPLQWMPHIQVADVASSVEHAIARGGTEVLHGRSDGGESLWAVLLDPNGAAFGIIPVVSEDAMPTGDGAESPKSIGTIAWLDLTVTNASATRDFYQAVVGWSVEEVEMQDSSALYADYTMLAGDGHPAAGVCHARGVNSGLPPVWLLYLPVGDLAESLRHVSEGGGTIVKATKTSAGKYASAVIEDPVGAHIVLVPG